MSKSKISNVFYNIKRTFAKRSPEILTGLGIAGMVTTTVLAISETPKAIRLLDEKKKELDIEKLRTSDVIKTTWKCYIPSAIICVLSTTCLIGASSVNLKRNAALAAAYQLSEKALTTYKDKVIEVVDEKKAELIKEKVAGEQIKENPVSKNEVIVTGNGEVLCYDVLSGRYFKSDVQKIENAVNVINKRMMNDWCVSLNELYDELDLGHTELGRMMGWNNDAGLIEISFDSALTENNTPCLVMNFDTRPVCDYSNL